VTASFGQNEQRRLADLVARTPSVTTVVLHGLFPGAVTFTGVLKMVAPSVLTVVVYHGSTALPWAVVESRVLMDALSAATPPSRTIDVLAMVKAGMEGALSVLTIRGSHPSVALLPNYVTLPVALPAFKYSDADGRLHVGLMSSSQESHKNFGTQLLAVCGMPNAVLHVTALPTSWAWTLACSASIIETGFLPHEAFMMELSRLDVVLYVSHTECSPNVVVEAAALGVPALVSHTHRLFAGSPGSNAAILSDALLVPEHDNPDEIRRRLLEVAARRHELAPLLRAHMECLHARAERAWSRILVPQSPSLYARLSLLADVDGDHNAPPLPECGPLELPLALALPPVMLHSNSRIARDGGHFAFLAYELEPLTPGGAGVVITALVEALLAAGHSVTILAYISVSTDDWAARLSRTAHSGQFLRVLDVPTLVDAARGGRHERDRDSGSCKGDIFLRRSQEFATATLHAHLNGGLPFDTVEAFDYAGVGALLARSEGRNLTFPFFAFLVRVHGSLELIDAAEALVAPFSPFSADSSYKERRLMHMLEREALNGAHAVLAPTAAIAGVYTTA
jgi:hypothetical protein